MWRLLLLLELNGTGRHLIRFNLNSLVIYRRRHKKVSLPCLIYRLSLSSFLSVVHFVAICIIFINTCMSLFPSDTAKFSPSMNSTMALTTELHSHKPIEILTAEKDVSQFQTSQKMVFLSAECGIINKVNQESMIKTCAAQCGNIIRRLISVVS